MWYALSIVRKAMEIDMSEYGFPPLYVGANVGYCWAEGKADHLEAPVLLMDEKIAAVNDMIARGEELPLYEDPRKVWEDEISYFALRQVEKEIIENNLTTMEQCYKNIRIMKYARHFEVKRLVNGEEKKLNLDNNIISLLLDRRNTAATLWQNFDAVKEMDIIEYHPTTISNRAVQLEDNKNAFLQVLREHMQYDNEKNLLTLKLIDVDSKFLSILDSILINEDRLHLFKRNQKLLKIRVEIEENGYVQETRLKGVLSGFLPTLKDLMVTHLRGLDYLKFDGVADKIGNTLLLDTLPISS